MGCRYKILTTMGFCIVGIRVKFPFGRANAFLCAVSTMDTEYWIVVLAGNVEFLDSSRVESRVVVSVHAWREPLAPLHHVYHLFISHNISL